MKKIISLTLSLIMLLSCPAIPSLASEDDDLNAYYDQAMQQYAGYEYPDPNVITDEELFGKWEDGQWTIEPLFDYEKYPEMATVEEMAQLGDYEGAKVAVLDYYRNGPFRNYKYLDSSIDGTAVQHIKNAEALMENMYFYADDGAPFAKVKLTSEDNWVSADAQYVVDKMIEGNFTSFTILALDLKKDGYTASFNSHENNQKDEDGNETDAYLELVVNGARRRYYVSNDAYVRGGDYFSDNFGSEDYLFSEESHTTINGPSPIDSYSRRAYLNFRLSDISADDTVSDAKIYLYGRMIESDTPDRPDVEKESIEVLLCDDPMRTFSENMLKWSTNTKDYAFSYDGEPGPQVIMDPTVNAGVWRHALDSQGYRSSVAVYRATKDEHFAYHAIRRIVHGINLRKTNFTQNSQPVYMVSLNVHFLFHAMPTLIYSEHMTPKNFTIILKWFHYNLDYIVNAWNIEGEGSNLGQMITQNLLLGAYMFEEFKRFAEPLGPVRDPQYPGSVTGGWAAVGAWRSIYKLQDTINPDGSGKDIPTGYVATNLSGFYTPYYKIEWILNKNLESVIDEDGKQLLRNVVKFVVDTSNPIFGVWQHGDDSSWNGNSVETIAKSYVKPLVEDDEFMNWFLSGGAEGVGPDYTTVFYDTVARGVLRSSWDKNAVSIEINADAGYTTHGHYDDCAINLMAYGKYLLADKNISNYVSDKGMYNWLKSTRAHNTIEINDTQQKSYVSSNMGIENYYDDPLNGSINKSTGPGTLHPENRETNGVYDFVRAETEGYVNNGALDSDYRVYRDVLFIKPGYFIVTDVINPEDKTEENKYSQAWHYFPESNVVIDPETLVSESNYATGANIVVAPVDDRGELTATVREGLFATESNTSQIYNTNYTQILKNVAGDTNFQTILYPEKPGEDVDIFTHRESLDVESNVADAFTASIVNTKTNATKNLAYYTLFDETQKAERIFGDYKTNGVLAFVETEDGRLSTIILRKGSLVEDKTGEKLLYSSEELEDVGIAIDGRIVNIETSKESDIAKFATAQIGIRANNPTDVLLNGEPIEYTYQNGYICINGFIPPEGSSSEEGSGSGDSGNHGTGGGIFTGGGSGGGGGSSEKDDESEKEETETKPETPVVTPDEKYPDIETHWAKNEITSLSEKGIISGYEDGTFKPDNRITRAEFLALATRLIDSEERADVDFNDVSSSDWYYDIVRKGVALGIISEDTSFRPNDLISREEMCKIVSGVAGKMGILEEDSEPIYFEDKDDISPWAENYVSKMTTNGIVKGNDRGEFLPKGKTTRAEAATVIFRVLSADAK